MRIETFLFSVLSIPWTAGKFMSPPSLSGSNEAHDVPALPTIAQRSVETSPNFTTYAPVRIKCPASPPQVRPAHGLSEEESQWAAGRKKKVLNGLSPYLRRLHLSDFDIEEYLKRLESDTSNVPNIAMALSGGGWAPSLTSTGPLLAFDDRFEESCKQ